MASVESMGAPPAWPPLPPVAAAAAKLAAP